MARRAAPPPQPERPILSIDQKRRGIARLRQRITELEAFDPQTVQKRFTDPRLQELETAIEETLSTIFGHNTVEYRRYRRATSLDHGSVRMMPSFDGRHYDDSHEARQYVTEGKTEAISLLGRAVRFLEEEIQDEEQETASIIDRPVTATSGVSKVFVVHGHDHGARDAVARFLEKVELEAIILHEQPDQGLTIIEKFEAYAKQVGFAVVLLTPDDIGGAVITPAKSARARQNVIFELGYFVGKLGRGRACLLRKGAVEIPSDLYGVIYTELDEADGWKLKLARELNAAGLKFDANKVFG